MAPSLFSPPPACCRAACLAACLTAGACTRTTAWCWQVRCHARCAARSFHAHRRCVCHRLFRQGHACQRPLGEPFASQGVGWSSVERQVQHHVHFVQWYVVPRVLATTTCSDCVRRSCVVWKQRTRTLTRLRSSWTRYSRQKSCWCMGRRTPCAACAMHCGQSTETTLASR